MSIFNVDAARELARQEMESIAISAGIECALLEDVVETEKGWVFFYNSVQFIETGDIQFALGGNGPLLIARDGTVRCLGTAQPWQDEFLNVCPNCGSAVKAAIGQHVRLGDHLTWSRSIHCDACGVATEEDGEGEPPAKIRTFLLERDGTWRISLCKPSDKFPAVVVLRKLFGLDLKAAAAFLRSPSLELWSGTQIECVWLSRRMQRIGVETAIQRIEKSSETAP